MNFRDRVLKHFSTKEELIARNRAVLPAYEEAVNNLVVECNEHDCFKAIFGDRLPTATVRDNGTMAFFLVGPNNKVTNNQHSLTVRMGVHEVAGYVNVHAVCRTRSAGSDDISNDNPYIEMHEIKVVANSPGQAAHRLSDIISDHVAQFSDDRDATVMRAMLMGEEHVEDLAPMMSLAPVMRAMLTGEEHLDSLAPTMGLAR